MSRSEFDIEARKQLQLAEIVLNNGLSSLDMRCSVCMKNKIAGKLLKYFK